MVTTDQVKRIEMTHLRKSGDLVGFSERLICWTYRGEPSGSIRAVISTMECDDHYMTLDYTIGTDQGEERRPINYRVKLVSTPCRYGGKRWWFLCPNRNCGRRNSILYECGDYFVCRTCAGLHYESQKYRKYSFLRILCDADDYGQTLKRWFYRGKPTRKHRRYLKMTSGMIEKERLDACIAALA